MGFFDRLLGGPRPSAPAIRPDPRLNPEPQEFRQNPGVISSSSGYSRDLRTRTGLEARYRIVAVVIDARNAAVAVTIEAGRQTKTVPAGAADRFAPAPGGIDEYSLSVDTDTADGDVELVEIGIPYQALNQLDDLVEPSEFPGGSF